MFGKRSDETRTSEDRARAAAQRAARRSGRPLPADAFEDAVPPPDLEDFQRPEPQPEPQQTVEYVPPFDEPGDARPEARVAESPSPGGSRLSVPESESNETPRVRRIPRNDPPTAEHEVEVENEAVAEIESPVAVTDPPPPPLSRPAPATPRKRPPAPGSPRRGRTGYWGRRVFGVIALIVIVAALYAINATFQPFHGGDDGSKTAQIVIPAGSDAGQIGKLLEAKGVIDSATWFQLNATLTGRRGKLRSGRFTLPLGMSNGDAISALTKTPKGPKAAATFKLTVTEGPSRKENAAAIDKDLEGNYLKASATPSVLSRVRRLGAPKGTKTAEGFLFPATYTLTSGATAATLVGEQLAAYRQAIGHVNMSYPKKKHLSRYDVLIIASMIEREAQLPRERALVSAVIYNRLKQGMTLGIDATIRYYTNNWQRPILQSELNKDEPYNLSVNRGLPPTPIGNPGLASLKAAAHPAKKSYLFYVRKPGKSGEHAFSSTDAQFEKDVQKYRDAQKGR